MVVFHIRFVFKSIYLLKKEGHIFITLEVQIQKCSSSHKVLGNYLVKKILQFPDQCKGLESSHGICLGLQEGYA